MIVHILIAQNSAEFNAGEIIIVAVTEEKAEEKLHITLVEQWKNANIDDKEFYETEEKYIDAWNYTVEPRELYE